jgi:hypothetical protein
VYSTAANISIATLNLSLMINSVGFYQIAKLLIIPFTAAVEALWLRETLTMPQTISTAVVLAGVAIVYVSQLCWFCMVQCYAWIPTEPCTTSIHWRCATRISLLTCLVACAGP